MKLSLKTEGKGLEIEISHRQKDRDSGLFTKVKEILRNNPDPHEAFRKASELITEDRLKGKGTTNG
jgi:hypothetical protein